MKTSEVIQELANRPTAERALIADSLLQTLHSAQADVEQFAQQHLSEISCGKMETITAEDVLKKIDEH
jgi:hypothetical protein